MQKNFTSLGELCSALITAGINFKFSEGTIYTELQPYNASKTNIRMAMCVRGQMEFVGQDYQDLSNPFVKTK